MKQVIGKNASLLAALVFAVGLLFVAMLSGIFSADASQHQQARPLLVKVAPARLQPSFNVKRTFVGRVEGRREVGAAFELNGKVNSVMVEEGDLVTQGQKLAVLDTEILSARRAELVANKQQAQSDMSLALLTLNRVMEAHELNATSDHDLDSAEKTYAASKAAFSNTTSAIASVDVQIAKSTLYAPFAAVVSRRYVDEGQILSSGASVIHLIEIDHPEVRFSVSNDIVQNLNVGDRHEIAVREHRISAQLKAVLPTREVHTRGVDVVFQLSAPLNGLRRGDLARIDLPVTYQQENAPIPLSAVTEGARGTWTTFVASPQSDGSYAVSPKQVTVLHQDQSSVYVTGTLAHGDLVITKGIHRLVPGQTVLTAPPASAG